jgi:glycerate dehydrogenase
MMKAAFLDFDTVSAGDLDTSKLASTVGELKLYDIDETKVAQMLRGVEVVLLNKVNLSRALLASAPTIKLVALAATGTDNVDLAAARALKIAVCNVRDYCTASVSQQVWALILSLNQHVYEYARLTQGGQWSRDETGVVLSLPIRELKGRIFGVVGWGNLGQGTARIAEAFGMRVMVAERPGSRPGVSEPPAPVRVPLEDLLKIADIVSLHCPLTDATRGLIGAAQLALMKPEALLINTARGGLIDGAALAAALKAKRLAGAGLDVLAREPPPADDPLLDPTLPNLLVTPHVAWAAREARQRCIDEIAANIQDFCNGGRRGRVV